MNSNYLFKVSDVSQPFKPDIDLHNEALWQKAGLVEIGWWNNNE